MAPEEAGIVNADTYMRVLVDWCIETKTTVIKWAGLPKILKCKWYLRSISFGYLKRINKTKSSNGDTWRLGSTYLKMYNTGIAADAPIKYSVPMSAERTIETISHGHVTCRQISDILCMKFETVSQYLKQYYEAGSLDRAIVRREYHYSIKEI